MSSQLLMIEDDARLAQMVGEYLGQSGLQVTHCADGKSGLARLQGPDAGPLPDLVILDLMLPDMDGLEVCRRIRALPGPAASVPLLMLTAKGDPMDRIIGLEMGADDYLPKPFEPRELVARVRALLRRRDRSQRAGPGAEVRHMAFAGWSLDLAARALETDGGIPVELTAGEFDLLAAFVRRPHQVLSRDDIMDVLKGRQADAFDRSIDIQVSRLRRKLNDDPRQPSLIRTVRNAGYLFTAEVTAS